MYSRILVPLDGSSESEQVLPYARQIGRALGARLDVIRVMEPLRFDLAEPEALKYLAEATEGQRAQASEYLERMAATLRESGLESRAVFLEGSAAFEIIAETEKEPDTLLAMSTHGRAGAGRWFLGSVTDKVLHSVSTPLLVVRARDGGETAADPKLTSMIVPLDGSPLAEEALPHAVALAKAMLLNVILVKVTPSSADYVQGMEYPFPHYDDLLKGVDVEAEEYLKDAGERVRREPGLMVEERLLHGNPGEAIVEFAQGLSENLVAMSTHGRSGVGRWVLGSVADRVIRQAGDPVLVIRGGR